ncbi:hypothetical protein BH09MYX1_BH09MYX1_16000 [soil metagenome]
MRLIDYLLLPKTLSDFERRYLARMNKVAIGVLAIHVPVLTLVAVVNGTGALKALLLSLFVFAGPVLASRAFANPRHVSKVVAVASMCFGGILVQFGQGPLQIEMHFYFFVLIGLLAVFGDPLVIVVAATTVALHHFVLWAALPRSVFNYDASLWSVLVHVIFVVVSSIGACFIARSFFDSVIGLEKIVDKRTKELGRRTADLRLILDSVDQGFMTFDREGTLSKECSAILETWIGPNRGGAYVWDYLGARSPELGTRLEMGLQMLAEDMLPLELAIDQLPKQALIGGRTLELTYRPIENGMLVVLSDATAKIESSRLEEERAGMLAVIEHVSRDRDGFVEFVEEASHLVSVVADEEASLADRLRALHTLKGNCSLLGLAHIARRCDDLETKVAETDELERVDYAELARTWSDLMDHLRGLLGDDRSDRIVVAAAEHARLLDLAAMPGTPAALRQALVDLRLDSTDVRLERMAEQARKLATKLDKGPIEIALQSNGLRIAREVGLWSSLAHVVRNAIDHGIEAPDERVAAGKSAMPTLTMSTSLEGDDFVCEIRDDGRGIDWELVREKARARGIGHDTEEELHEALFADGLSTKDVATDVSGRGIGMGAIRASCERIGGSIRIRSRRGMETRVELRVPQNRVRMPAAAAHAATGGAS